MHFQRPIEVVVQLQSTNHVWAYFWVDPQIYVIAVLPERSSPNQLGVQQSANVAGKSLITLGVLVIR